MRHRLISPKGGLGLGALALCMGCTVRGGVVEAPPPIMEPEPALAPASGTVQVAAAGELYPDEPPPDPIPEVAPPAPGYDYVWVSGYWNWDGFDWIWVDGYWAPRRVGYVYVAPRYVFIDGRLVFYRAYWRGPYGGRQYGYGYGPEGRRAPPPAYRAHPSHSPATWRTTHRDAWRSRPGADAWRAEHQQRERTAPRGGSGAEPRREQRRAPSGGGGAEHQPAQPAPQPPRIEPQRPRRRAPQSRPAPRNTPQRGTRKAVPVKPPQETKRKKPEQHPTPRRKPAGGRQ